MTRESAARPSSLILLGEEQVRQGSSSLAAGEPEAFQFRARNSGTTQSVHVYVGIRSTATSLVAGVYGTASGHPGALLTSGTLPSPRGGAWDTVPVAAQQLVVGGTYWLAVLGNGGQLRIRDRHEGNCAAASSAQRGAVLAGAWRTAVVGRTCPISAYVTGGPPVPGEPKLEEPIGEVPPVPGPPHEEPPVKEPPSEEPPVKEPPAKEPPLPPTNTALPAISGSTVEGRTLSASNGTWTGSPTSFSYRWQDCDALGASCTTVAGATASSYTLGAADAGHTMRILVTATSSGGSTSASSAATAAVAQLPPPPPVNTALPVISGLAVEGQSLSASKGTWTGGASSFAYQWQDCNLVGAFCANVPGASGSSYTLGSADVGHTVRVVVTASNASPTSASASSAATVPVTGIPPLPPVNTGLPAISGSTVEGQTLSASNGSWTGSPTSFAKQWQRCNAGGASCAAVGGATGSTFALGASDVGQTLRVVVTAKNAGGSTAATSTATAVVTAAQTGSSCFADPESCGYPGMANTGANCSALTPSGSVTASASGQKVENLNIKGTIVVAASKVTINNVCVTTNGGAQLGSAAVFLSKGATETTISNSTIRGEDESTHSIEEAISNNYGNAGAVASKVQLYNCGECIHQTWTLTKSYVNANGMRGTTDHYEDWYYSDTTVVATEDTMLNPEMQTAVLFGDTHVGGGGPCDNHVTVTGSLVAGGGGLFYPCGNASSVGSSTMTIKNNRFARCLGAHQYQPESGGTLCAGGSDIHGYFPFGGFFFTAAYIYSGPGQVWEGNIWDDNHELAAP